MKGKLGQTLWIRNLQLSIYGVPLSLAYTYLKGWQVECMGAFGLQSAHILQHLASSSPVAGQPREKTRLFQAPLLGVCS